MHYQSQYVCILFVSFNFNSSLETVTPLMLQYMYHSIINCYCCYCWNV